MSIDDEKLLTAVHELNMDERIGRELIDRKRQLKADYSVWVQEAFDLLG